MKLLLSLLGLLCPLTAYAQACNCLEFPFKPEPPCNAVCLKKLTATPNPDLSKVKALDPGVALSIKVIAKSPDASKVDYGKFGTKADLERLALGSIEQGNVIVKASKQGRDLIKKDVPR